MHRLDRGVIWVRIFCLNIQFYLLFVLSSMVVIPLLALYVSFIRLFNSRHVALDHFRRVIGIYGRLVLCLPYPLIRIRGKDIGGGVVKGSCLYVINHRSMADPFLMGYLHKLIPGLQVVQVTKSWVLRLPLFGVLARLAGYLSVSDMALDDFYSVGKGYFEEGLSIICFPEGTRSGSMDMGPFHGTIFRLAIKAEVPIVPICISGNENIPVLGSLLMHPGVIKIHKLPAIQPDSYAGMTAFQLKNRVRDIISTELSKMDSISP